MSPANIEATLKAASPLIGQACVIGDARPYNVALIVLDPDWRPGWAQQERPRAARRSRSWLRRGGRIAEIQAAIDAANEKLSRVEQIKRFTLLPTDWQPGGDELTPTMKLKRKPIAAKYDARDRGALYAELAGGAGRPRAPFRNAS